MKASLSKISGLWNTREVFFDKLWQRLKIVTFVLFLVLLILNIFSNGYSGRWVECLVDVIALIVIVKTTQEVGILVRKIKGIPLVSQVIPLNPSELLAKNLDRDDLERKYEKILKRYERG